MRAASRESLAAATQRLEAVIGGTGSAALTTLAEELLAFAGLLGGQPALRRALSDPARDIADRQTLARQLLVSKLGDTALELIDGMIANRWSAPSDLLDAAERLGVQSLLASAEKSGELAEVEDELFRFQRIVSGQPSLAATLADSSADKDRRRALVERLLAGKARPVTVRLAQIAVNGYGGRSFDGSLIALVEAAATRRDRQIAYVTSAVPLSDAEERRLADILTATYGRDISVKVAVDPRVLGGLSVQVADDLYDGTVAHRLAAVRIALGAH